ncbi:MAG: hypothetical protein E7318_02300 [Clostridiales bacterium]|nr:hypothetical protein [Clostridiales bacterium]
MEKVFATFLVIGILYLIIRAVNRYRAGAPKRQEKARKRVLEEKPDAAGDELDYLSEKQRLKQSCLHFLPGLIVSLLLAAPYLYLNVGEGVAHRAQVPPVALTLLDFSGTFTIWGTIIFGFLILRALVRSVRLTRDYQRFLVSSMKPEPLTAMRSPLEMRDALLKACKQEYGPKPIWLFFAAPWTLFGLGFGLAAIYSPESLSGNLPPWAAVSMCFSVGAVFLWLAFRKMGIIWRVRQNKYVPLQAVCTATHHEKKKTTRYSDFSVSTYTVTTMSFSAGSSTYTVTSYRAILDIEVDRIYALYFFGKEGHISAICDEEQNKVLFIR